MNPANNFWVARGIILEKFVYIPKNLCYTITTEKTTLGGLYD